jgi:hypothetical protein
VSSDEENQPLPKRAKRSPTAEINTDFIDRALSAAFPKFHIGIDEASPIRSVAPVRTGDAELDLGSLRELIAHLPGRAVGALAKFVKGELEALGPAPPGAFGGPEGLRRRALCIVLRRTVMELKGVLEVPVVLERAMKEVREGPKEAEVEDRVSELRAKIERSEKPSFNPYVELRKQLAFAVARLEKDPPRAVVGLRGERMEIAAADSGWLHTQVAVAQRWSRFRREFLALMKKVHGLMFADQRLSFMVVSPRTRARFAVVLKVPTAYPWGKVTVAAVRVDFGVEQDETRRTVTEIAGRIPIGPRWITKFVDAILRKYEADG